MSFINNKKGIQKRDYTLIKNPPPPSTPSSTPLSTSTSTGETLSPEEPKESFLTRWWGWWPLNWPKDIADGIMIVSETVLLFCFTVIAITAFVLYSRDTKDEIACHPPKYMTRLHHIKDVTLNTSQLTLLAATSMEYDFSLSSKGSSGRGSPLGKCRTFCQRAFNIKEYHCKDSHHCRECHIPSDFYSSDNISKSPYTACISACASCASLQKDSKHCPKHSESFLKDGACGFDCKLFSSAWSSQSEIKCR